MSRETRIERVRRVLNLTAGRWDQLWWQIREDYVADGAGEQDACYAADADMHEQFGPRPGDAA